MCFSYIDRVVSSLSLGLSSVVSVGFRFSVSFSNKISAQIQSCRSPWVRCATTEHGSMGLDEGQERAIVGDSESKVQLWRNAMHIWKQHSGGSHMPVAAEDAGFQVAKKANLVWAKLVKVVAYKCTSNSWEPRVLSQRFCNLLTFSAAHNSFESALS